MTELRTPPPLTADQLGAPSAPMADDPILSAYGPEPEPAEPTDAPGLPGIGPDEVALFLEATGDVLTQLTRHEHWRIARDEVALPSAAIARQLAKPDTAFAAWLAQHADAVLIVVGLGAVFVPRSLVELAYIREERRLRALERAQEMERVPHYGYDESAGANDWPPAPSARGGISAGGYEGAAAGAPTDPENLAAAVGGILGS